MINPFHYLKQRIYIGFYHLTHEWVEKNLPDIPWDEIRREQGDLPHSPAVVNLPVYPLGWYFWETPAENYWLRNEDGSPYAPEGWKLLRCFDFDAHPHSSEDVLAFYLTSLTEQGWTLIEQWISEKPSKPDPSIILKSASAMFLHESGDTPGSDRMLLLDGMQWSQDRPTEVTLRLFERNS